MLVYTRDSNFKRRDVINEFESVIWTERYNSVGDFTLVLPFSVEALQKLAVGTFVGLSESDETMIVETHSIENDKLTITGPNIMNILEHRFYRSTVTHTYQDFAMSGTPEELIEHILNTSVIDNALYMGNYQDHYEDDKHIITNLEIAPFDNLGTVLPDKKIPFGSVLKAILELVELESMGIKLVLTDVTESSYELSFVMYYGRDLTSDQDVFPIVRFSPILDSFTDIKELNSISKYKNVAYAFSPNYDPDVPEHLNVYSFGEAYILEDPEEPELEVLDWGRRTLIVFNTEMSEELCGNLLATYKAQMDLFAQQALLNNNYTKLVDGEIVPQPDFKYGEHYMLGDIIELHALSGQDQKARITEYIWTQDVTGVKEYPTISAI